MSEFKEEEWQNYLDNMVPGYSRKINTAKIKENSQKQSTNNEKNLLNQSMTEILPMSKKE